MSGDENPLDAEMALLQSEDKEQRDELAQNLKVIGDSFGVHLSPNDFTSERAELFTRQVVDLLNGLGNGELAEQLFFRHLDRKKAMQRFEELNRQAEAAGHVDDDSLPMMEAAKNVVNAQDHFERVLTEVGALLKSLRTESGA